MQAQTMKAARIHRQGPPEVLVYEDTPMPTLLPGDVLIRNEAAGINFADVERRRGGYYPVPVKEFPAVLGGEFAGEVTEVADDASDWKAGDKVFGIVTAARSGTYAQYLATEARNLYPLPPGIDFADAPALLIQGLTAYFLVRDAARVSKDDTVLILAAAGGVGSLAVQLARIMGAGRIIGAASTPEKRELALGLGADAVVDYTRPGWSDEVRRLTEGRGVDAVLLSGGGDMFTEALACLAPRGRAAVFGSANGEMPVVDFAAHIGAGRMSMNQTVGFFGLHYYQAHARAEVRQALDELAELVRTGRLRLDHGHRFPLSAAAEAHHCLEHRQSTGKLVLLPWAD
ncbi:zinc-binding alcohol dehydrogenase family protein [Streptomyces sp. NPDC091280]|uniref:quinone oxidoreductase family protein n=1 Tax=Streptomyces sp. NPDC091280 TaxID=3365984 RepID=UPI003825B899